MSEGKRNLPAYRFPEVPPSSVLAPVEPRLVYLPGYKGIPVRGILSPEEIISKAKLNRLKRVFDVHFRVFDLAIPEEKQLYEKLMSAAGNNSQHVVKCKEVWPEGFGDSHWKVAVKWTEAYLEDSEKRHGIMMSDGNPLGA